MSEHFRNMALGGDNGQVFLGDEIARQREYSETTAREIDEEVRMLLETSYKKAVNTLKSNREALGEIADLLLEEEEIPGSKVLKVLQSHGADVEIDEEQMVEEDGEVDGEVESVSTGRDNSEQTG